MNDNPPLKASILGIVCLLASIDLNANEATVRDSTPTVGSISHLLMYHRYPDAQITIANGHGNAAMIVFIAATSLRDVAGTIDPARPESHGIHQ